MLPNMLVVECRGNQFLIFDKPDVISDGLRSGVGHDAWLEYYSTILVGDNKDGVILDIGSNIGTYVVPLAKQFPNIEFYGFEPQRIIFYQLCANVILNGLENVHLINKGLGETATEVEIFTPDYSVEVNIGAFSLDTGVHENNNVCASQGRLEKIQIDRLDDYGFQNIRLIKIDVEGLELAVIKGGLETLKANDYPPIIFETWSIMDWYQERRKEILSYVESFGYDITSIGDNCIAQHTSRKVIKWANGENRNVKQGSTSNKNNVSQGVLD